MLAWRKEHRHWRWTCAGLWDVGLLEMFTAPAYGVEPSSLTLREPLRSRWLERLDYAAGVIVRDADFGVLERHVLARVPRDASSTTSVEASSSVGISPPSPNRADVSWDTVEKMASHVALMVALREVGGGYVWSEPFAWARRFAAAYCGVSERQARGAIPALIELGVLEPAGELRARGRRPTPLYRLGGVA